MSCRTAPTSISGGDALVSIELKANAQPVRVKLNGANITSSFAVRDNGKLEGLVTGLVEGNNLLRVMPANGAGRSLKIKNHPIGGPVFSGSAGPAVALPDTEPDEPHARPVERRAVQCADEDRALLPQSLEPGPVRRVRPGEPAGAGAHSADDDRPGQDRSVHRGAGHRDGQPWHLPVRPARRPDEDGVPLDRAAVEPQVRQLVRRRLQRQLPAADCRKPARQTRACSAGASRSGRRA